MSLSFRFKGYSAFVKGPFGRGNGVTRGLGSRGSGLTGLGFRGLEVSGLGVQVFRRTDKGFWPAASGFSISTSIPAARAGSAECSVG